MIAYPGNTSRLVLSFDIGSTYSRVSYCILEPRKIPEIRVVSKYPTQGVGCEDPNIPTAIYYDRGGVACAIGAETIQEGIREKARRNGWMETKWLTLALRFHATPIGLPSLWNVSILDMWAHFLGYLHRCALQYIESNCDDPSEYLRSPVEFVISYPNGWSDNQLDKLRKASAKGGLVSDETAAAKNIHFVAEGKAELNFLVRNGFDMNTGDSMIIIDASEVVIACNIFEKVSETSFKEVCPSQTHYEGSYFIKKRAHDFIHDLLETSKFHGEVDRIVEIFDESAKLRFGSATECTSIRFGDIEDEDIDLNIYSGRLRLRRTDVASFFDPAVHCIVQAIVEMRNAARSPTTFVVLLGGFGRNEYIYSKLQEPIQRLGLDFYRPLDSEITQSVASGGISFCLSRSIFWRTSRHAYGVIRSDGSFYVILPRGESVVENKEFRQAFNYEPRLKTGPHIIVRSIGYQATTHTDATATCTVEAPLNPRRRVAKDKKTFTSTYSIVFTFGYTEFKVRIVWDDCDTGCEVSGPEEDIPYQD